MVHRNRMIQIRNSSDFCGSIHIGHYISLKDALKIDLPVAGEELAYHKRMVDSNDGNRAEDGHDVVDDLNE